MIIFDLLFYLAGIVAVSWACFKAGKIATAYVLENWFPYVCINISAIDEHGVKRNKRVWLDKRIPEDAKAINSIDSIKRKKAKKT